MNLEAVAIYGAGSFGQNLASKLSDGNFLSAKYFIDAKASPELSRAKLKVLPVQEEYVAEKDIFIAVLNNEFDVALTVSKLKEMGARSVFTPPQVFQLLREFGVEWEWYWLTTSELIRARDIATRSEVEQRMGDLASIDLYRAICDYRLNGDPACLRAPRPFSTQYLDSGIAGFWNGTVDLVDCGAYTGDSIEKLISGGVKINEVWAFEPDPSSFAELERYSRKTDVLMHAYPIATGDIRGVVRFDARSADGSAIRIDGAVSVPIQPIDDILLSAPITHVKLDVEGAEIASLRGMKNLLTRCRPKLAVSVYHRPNDIEDVIEFVVEVYGEAALSLKCFAHQTLETVLYVSPG